MNNKEENKKFKDYKEYEEYYFNKIDSGWKLPQPSDEEIDIIHRLAKIYCVMLCNEIKSKKIKPDKLHINKLYQLMFKLNMLVDPE